jgi:hypothetical protein
LRPARDAAGRFVFRIILLLNIRHACACLSPFDDLQCPVIVVHDLASQFAAFMPSIRDSGRNIGSNEPKPPLGKGKLLVG